jgi:hypothetical protein
MADAGYADQFVQWMVGALFAQECQTAAGQGTFNSLHQ